MDPEMLKEIREKCLGNPQTTSGELAATAGCSGMTLAKVLKAAGVRNEGTKLKKDWVVDPVWGDLG